MTPWTEPSLWGCIRGARNAEDHIMNKTTWDHYLSVCDDEKTGSGKVEVMYYNSVGQEKFKMIFSHQVGKTSVRSDLTTGFKGLKVELHSLIKALKPHAYS